MDAWYARLTRARSALALEENFQYAIALVRHHPRRGLEVAALVVLAASFHFLAGWTSFRTGSVGEAHMVHVLAAGAQVGWFLLLPLGVVRWWRAGAGEWPVVEGAPVRMPGSGKEESWAACGRRLLVALLTIILAPSAAVMIMVAFAVQGSLSQLVLLMATTAVAMLVGEAVQGNGVRRISADRTPVPRVRSSLAASPSPSNARVDDVPSLVENEAAGWRGAAAAGRFPTRGLPEGVVARAEFFSDLEFELRRTQRDQHSYTLLIVGPDASGGEKPPPTVVRQLLGDVLARTFGGAGLVGYLGGDRWGIGLSAASTDKVTRDVLSMRMLLEKEGAAHGGAAVSACIGASVGLGTESARDLYANALTSLQSALERSAVDPV